MSPGAKGYTVICSCGPLCGPVKFFPLVPLACTSSVSCAIVVRSVINHASNDNGWKALVCGTSWFDRAWHDACGRHRCSDARSITLISQAHISTAARGAISSIVIDQLAATLRWFTAGGAIGIAVRQLSQTWKLRHLWRHNLGSRWKLQKVARNNFSIGALYNITKNQDNPIKTVGRDSFLSPKTPKIFMYLFI